MTANRPDLATTARTVTAIAALSTIVGVAAAQPGDARAFPVTDRIVVFAVSLLVGGLAIHAGARVVGTASTYAEAVLTALLGAVAWALLDPVPLLGTALALVAWIAVLKWRYPVGWLRAIVLGVAAWAVAVVVLAALTLVGVGSLDALGVPGT